MEASPKKIAGPRVLVVDDEENLRLVLRTLLRSHGYEVAVASNAEEALRAIDEFRPAFVLSDVRMPGMSGLSLARDVKARDLAITVILMSAYGSVDTAIEAMKAGAYDYVQKPFKQDEVLLALKKAEERESLRQENRVLREAVKSVNSFGDMIGKSDAMRVVFRTLEKVADVKTTVLIQGESGTGKELVARALHQKSARAAKAFVAVNCGAIPEALLESELFGHKRGAFTDANADKKGLFEQADGGTLFLDEIGELPLSLQVKLLRALQESTIRRLGDTRDIQVDIRLVAATVRDLEREVQEGRFREDLFYRLNVLPIAVPALRERREDIPMLVEHFLKKSNARLSTHVREIAQDGMKILYDYDWPGNVRELENTLERAVVLAESEVLSASDFPERIRSPRDNATVSLDGDELSIKKTTRILEEKLIRRALDKTRGNRTAAAKILEISHRALLYKIKEYGIT